MPFTQAPVISTYSTEKVALATDILLRPSSLANSNNQLISQDAGLVNLISIKEGDKKVAVTRPYIDTASSLGSSFAGTIRGIHVWEKDVGTTYYFAIVGVKVYTSTDGINFTQVDTLLTNVTTPVRFTEYIDATNVKKLILVDGVEGYIYTTNAAGTKIVSGNFPTPHVPFPIFLDGYLFLAKANTGDIYNSDLNAPQTWTAGSFLSAEMYPDNIQALVKVDNYILAIGTQSSEYFYDAANATASPLARIDGATLPLGTLIPNSIAVNKNSVMMIANNNDGSATIVEIQDQKHKAVGANFLVPLLNSRLTYSGVITTPGVRAYFFRHRSLLMYGITFSDQSTATLATPQYSPTFIYSVETGEWSEFRLNVDGTAAFPIAFTFPATSTAFGTYCAGNLGLNSSYFGVIREGTGVIYAYDTVGGFVYPIYQEWRTENMDNETMNRKFMSRASVVVESGESALINSQTNSALSLSWSDDDYSTWTTTTLDLGTTDGTNNDYYPSVTQLGSYRRRAFRGVYKGARFMVWRRIEFDINKGQQ